MIQKERILYWDVIKAFAIFLVVWGHCLQYLQLDTENCWNSYTCGFIYSFHMPLFMMVSGYFARSIYNKSFSDNLKNKSLQILLPSISTYIVVGLLLIYLRHEPWEYGLEKLGINCFTSYWFLKALYILYIAGIIFTWIYRKNKYAAVITVIVSFTLLHDNVEFVHSMSMLPFFLAGMLLYKYENIFWRHKANIALCCASICAILCYKYDIVEYNMYMHPFQFETDAIYIFAIRTIIGTSASLLCIILIRAICENVGGANLVGVSAKIGTMTLGIYVYHREMALLSNHFAARIQALNPLGDTTAGYLFYEYGICLMATIIFMTASVLIILLLRKNKYSRLFFLGEK